MLVFLTRLRLILSTIESHKTYGTILWHLTFVFFFVLQNSIKLFTFNTDQCLTPMWKRMFKQYSIQWPFI
jgi:hypothetical protein